MGRFENERKRIFNVIEISSKGDIFSKIYDIFMICIIVVSFTPLFFKGDIGWAYELELITTLVFVVDYILRFITADFRAKSKGIMPFVLYPFTFMAMVDLISIVPSIIYISGKINMFRLLRIFRIIRITRVFRVMRYSRNVYIIYNVFRKQKRALCMVMTLACGYILVSALIVFNVEPETFETFFDAIYWATVSLTTVGYGDIYPVSTLGRVVTMVSSFFGIAIIALPAGIISAEYMVEIKEEHERMEKTQISTKLKNSQK